MTSGEGVLVLGRDHIRHYYYSKYALSSTISIYSTLIVIVLWDYTAVFLCNCWILFILLWGWWYANMSPLTKNQCRVSDTQVSVNACMPFLQKNVCCYKSMMNWQVILHGTGWFRWVISNQHQNFCYTDMINKQWYSFLLPPSIML